MKIDASAFTYIVEGSLVTMLYSVCSVGFGLVIGTLLALMKLSNRKVLTTIANIYTSIFRGTPLLIQLSIIYFALPSLLDVQISGFIAGVIAFSLNSGAYVSEIARAGIQGVDGGQLEAARTLNIPTYHAMKDIILPQALRNVLPSLTNELISLVKETSIISLIGELDLMRRAQMIAAQSYDYFTPLCVAGGCYYILILLIGRTGKYLEGKLNW